MTAENGVNPDPTVWSDVLDDYSVRTIRNGNVITGQLSPGLDEHSPEVIRARQAWPARAHFAEVDGRTEVVLVYETFRPRERYGLHLLLFVATLITTFGSGALMRGVDPFRTRFLELGDTALPYPSGIDFGVLATGADFAIPFMFVLLVHEMAHFFAARMHRVRASLPYFLPFPPYYSVIGTLGAFIRIRTPSVRRSIIFDIGASGPFASFLASVPLFAWGMHLSRPVPGSASLSAPFLVMFTEQPVWLGNGVGTHLLATLFGPGPVGDTAILLHPWALAGWLGLFVTALNLLPLGQLDGGHALYAMAPRLGERLARVFIGVLFILGFAWRGWWAWAILVLVLHRGRMAHPAVLQPGPDPGSARRALGWALLLIFLLTMTPVPLRL